MNSQSLEVVVGITIVAAVTYLLRLIFNFIIKLKDSPASAVKQNEVLYQTKMLTQEDYEKIMNLAQDLENIDWKKLENWNRDLWNWHNERDEDGVPRWYVRKSIEENIKKHSDMICELTAAVDRLAANTATQTEMISRLIEVLARRI